MGFHAGRFDNPPSFYTVVVGALVGTLVFIALALLLT